MSERLGHATVAFTMQVYAHAIPGMQADAAAAFSDLVFLDDDAEPEQTANEKEGELFRELGTRRPENERAGAFAPALTCICDGGGGRI